MQYKPDDGTSQEASQQTGDATHTLHERLRRLNAIITELTRCSTIDDLCHDAIEAGIHRLGFDRMGIGFFDETGDYYEGSFGTDEQGKVRDERNSRILISQNAIMTAAFENHSTLEYFDDTPLFNTNHEAIARGWNALALLWDGVRALGWVSVDNLLNQRPLTAEDFDILTLYGSSLGHLCTLKRTEQALRHERNLLHTIINTVNDYIFVKDTQSRFSLVNTASWKTSKRGVSETDMLGKTDFDYFPHDLAQKYFEEEQGIFRDGRSIINMLEPNVSAEGDPVVMLTSKVPLRNEHNEIIGLVGISRDVTSYMRAQQQVQLNEARFKLINEMATASNIGVVMGDYRTNICQANDAFLRITGYDRADLPHLNLNAMTPPEYLDSTLRTGEHAPDSEIIAAEKELICKDQHRVPVLQVGNFVGKSSQDFICFIVDLTLQRQLEAERIEISVHRERSNLLTEFISNLSHDLKTPLAIIKTSLYLFERMQDPTYQKARIQNIHDQVLLLDKLIQSVLAMVRLDSGYELTFGPLDLNQVMTVLERSMRPAAERKDQHFVLELNPDVPPIRASESELYRVIVNLIENALAYTQESGVVTLRTYRHAEFVVGEVQDTGMGIDPQILPYIFDRFVRGETARVTAKGTGLGLAIVRRVMDLHGGRVEVDSILNVGSTFRIYIPVWSEQASM
ncbi:MAG: PAS domain S-box protein [Anaerolineae bacterium]|nr:PAS domain S-box protein [Anaerolineae bacterium]